MSEKFDLVVGVIAPGLRRPSTCGGVRQEVPQVRILPVGQKIAGYREHRDAADKLSAEEMRAAKRLEISSEPSVHAKGISSSTRC